MSNAFYICRFNLCQIRHNKNNFFYDLMLEQIYKKVNNESNIINIYLLREDIHMETYETHDLHKLLLDIGIPSSLLGYTYIIEGLRLIECDNTYLRNITKRLYVDVAHTYNVTPSRVERNIRHAIGKGWRYGNENCINDIFHNSINPKKGVPTNLQFFSTIYFYINRARL